MPRVLFVAAPEPRSVPAGEAYAAGQVYDLTRDQAERWKRRGVAIDAPEPELVPVPAVVAEPLPVEAPVVVPAAAFASRRNGP